MKVRITGNKIRLRLKEPEVQGLYKGASIKEVLEFGPKPDQQLQFYLKTYEEPHLGITYRPGNLVINMPKAFSEALATTANIGFDGCVNTDHSSTIYVLIEKDFECLDGNEEDNAGSYPNPKQVC